MTDTTQWRSRPYAGYYKRQVGAEDSAISRSDPGTPMGEFMRRFWQPVALVSQLSDVPIPIRILGEDLVVFRDLSGRLGVLHRHCSHRRTSLEYGIIAQNGVRCCYHGWLFGVDGQILETPGEPESSPIRRILCHGAYPAIERDGIIFSYLGPPEEKPEFPEFDTFALPGTERVPYLIDYPCNWLQVAENPMDPFHSVFLHTRVTRAHFNPAWGALPIVEWHPTPEGTGVWLTNARFWKGYLWVRTAEHILPNFAQPPDIYQDPDREKIFPRVGISKWTVPVDDTHSQIIGWRHFSPELDLGGKGDRSKVGLNAVDFLGQTGFERSHAEAVRTPGDYEAQIGQGPIALHSLETLGKTDAGVLALRRLLRRAVDDLARGQRSAALERNAEGRHPTMAGDVILLAPNLENDAEAQRRVARRIGEAIWSTRLLRAAERRREIERLSRAALSD